MLWTVWRLSCLLDASFSYLVILIIGKKVGIWHVSWWSYLDFGRLVSFWRVAIQNWPKIWVKADYRKLVCVPPVSEPYCKPTPLQDFYFFTSVWILFCRTAVSYSSHILYLCSWLLLPERNTLWLSLLNCIRFQTIAPTGQDLPQFYCCCPECLQVTCRYKDSLYSTAQAVD